MSRCRGCNAAIVWIQMGPRADGSPGGTMPVDEEMRQGDSRRNLVVLDSEGRGRLLVKPGPDQVGREPHWATCPKRKQFKRKRAK